MTAQVRRWVLANSLLASVLLHGALFGGGLGYIHWRDSRLANAIEIDLGGQSLIARPANPGGASRSSRPPELWYLAGKGKPAPKPLAPPPDQAPEPLEEESAGPPCPHPCPESPGDWVPAAATSRKPVWSQGLITEDDYPRELRREGKEGKVVAEVLIDAAGVVRDVSLREASHPQFNEVVLDRLRKSRFKPAYDSNGDPVPVRLILPIVFTLN
jgi:protein TonB